MSRRERTETIIECDACKRGMREHEPWTIGLPQLDLCETCVRMLLKLEAKLAAVVVSKDVELQLNALRNKARA